MKRYSFLILAACACFSLVSCASRTRPQVVSKNVAASADLPVIVRLVGRHETITVLAGPKSALYSAHAPDGSAIVTNVTLEEMRLEHPGLYHRLRPVVAAEMADVFAGRAE